MARSASTAPESALNERAVQVIEEGLGARRTVREILTDLRREPAFREFGQARIMKCWNQVWRPMVAEAGRVPLPQRGGPRGRSQVKPAAVLQENRPTAPVLAKAPASPTVLEAMLDALCGLLAEAPDGPARQAALKALPGFVRAVRQA